MTATKFIVATCDVGGPDCAYDDDPIQGDPDETLTELLRTSGWVRRRGGKHVCRECQVRPR